METVFIGYLLKLAFSIVSKHKAYISEKLVLVALYNISIACLFATLIYNWAVGCVGRFIKLPKFGQLGLYFLTQVMTLLLQECLLLILYEFYVQMKLMVEGNMWSNSIVSS